MEFLLEGHWLSLFECSKNSWITPKLLFPGSSRETLHPKTQWVRNEGRSPGWVFSCCHQEESLVESIQKNWVRLTSLYPPISLHSYTPQMDWQFSASTNIKTCDYDVLQSKIIQHTQISLESLDSCKWEGWDRVMCFHGCSGQLCFVWEEEIIVFHYVEGKSFLNLKSLSPGLFSLSLVFSICYSEVQELGKSVWLTASSSNKVIHWAVHETTQSKGQSLFQESERTVIHI